MRLVVPDTLHVVKDVLLEVNAQLLYQGALSVVQFQRADVLARGLLQRGGRIGQFGLYLRQSFVQKSQPLLNGFSICLQYRGAAFVGVQRQALIAGGQVISH